MGTSLFDLPVDAPRDTETFDLFGEAVAPPSSATSAPDTSPPPAPDTAGETDLFGAPARAADPAPANDPSTPLAPVPAPHAPPPVAPLPIWVELARAQSLGQGAGLGRSAGAVVHWREEGLRLMPLLEGDGAADALPEHAHLALIEAGVRFGGMPSHDAAAVDQAVALMAHHHAQRDVGRHLRQAERGEAQATTAMWFVVQRGYEERDATAARGPRHAIYADAYLAAAVEKAAGVLLEDRWPPIVEKARDVAARRAEIPAILAAAQTQAGKARAHPQCMLHEGIFTGDPDTLVAHVGYAAALMREAQWRATAARCLLDRAVLTPFTPPPAAAATEARSEESLDTGMAAASLDVAQKAAEIPAPPAAPESVAAEPPSSAVPDEGAPLARPKVEDATVEAPSAADWRAGLRRPLAGARS